MDKKNLDDYLANLGISEGDEAPPLVEAAGAAPISPQTALEVFEAFMQGVVAHLGQDLTLSVRDTGEALEADIGGERASKLAGREGRTLGRH